MLAVATLGLIAVACSSDGDGGTAAGNTLQTVMDRGELKCGVKDSQPGFGNLEPDGSYTGFDIEFCKAIAAAVFGDSSKVEFVPASAQDRFELLSSSEIDVLIRTTTWTASRDAGQHANFGVVTFYDGQGMMVRKDSGFTSLEDLANATICVTTGTTTEQNLEDRMSALGIAYTPLGVADDAAAQAAFLGNRCDGWTGDKSNLAGQRSAIPAADGGPDSAVILPVTLSKEPLAPATRDNDSAWYDVVNWVVLGMITADELGVNSSNVAQMAANPPSADVARLLGASFNGGEVTDFGLGIEVDFMQKVLAQVGNYDEAYKRTLEPIGLTRAGSLNALWTNGGIVFAPPMR